MPTDRTEVARKNLAKARAKAARRRKRKQAEAAKKKQEQLDRIAPPKKGETPYVVWNGRGLQAEVVYQQARAGYPEGMNAICAWARAFGGPRPYYPGKFIIEETLAIDAETGKVLAALHPDFVMVHTAGEPPPPDTDEEEGEDNLHWEQESEYRRMTRLHKEVE